MQSIGWLVRKAASAATITIDVKEYEGPASPADGDEDVTGKIVTHIDIDQVASGLKSSPEPRSIDGVLRKTNNWIWGNVQGRTSWVTKEELYSKIKAEFGDWVTEGWDESDTEFVYAWNESTEKSWISIQIWGFTTLNGERRFARKIFTKSTKGDKSEKLMTVYDYEGESV